MDDLVVAYDVRQNRRRRRIFKTLHRWGEPVQKSVFLCRVRPRGFDRLRRGVEKWLDFETDGLLYVFLCSRCRERLRGAGQTTPGPADDVTIL